MVLPLRGEYTLSRSYSTHVREERAFDNMKKAIDMHESFEKVSINNHKSFLPHITIFKVRSRLGLHTPSAQHTISHLRAQEALS